MNELNEEAGLGRGTNEEGAPTSPVPAAERKEGLRSEERIDARLS